MTGVVRARTSTDVVTDPAPLNRFRQAPDRLLRLADVISAVGLGKTMIYRLIRQGRFPQPYKPGGHASRWSERELIEWQGSIERRRL